MKTQFADQRTKWAPGTNSNCKFCLEQNQQIKEDFKHVVYDCPTTKKALEETLINFNINGKEALKAKELILWKFIRDEKGVRQFNDEVILKTFTSLFLCTYFKMKYIAQNTA